MPSDHAPVELLNALGKLLGEVTTATLRYETPGASVARATQAAVADQLSDYVIPRLVQLDAPLLTVVGGSTGAGKSTLVNSLVGSRVTESGVLRPTTRSPVLVHHPDDAHWFQPDRILPDLPRTETPSNDVYALRLAASHGVPRGLAILDAPDVDSIDAGNRAIATQLLAAADLWLFVTSAARYADQVPWDYLRRASERSTSVAVVLDRTSEADLVEVRGHLARMMTSRGLSDSPLFTVPESGVDADGLIPAAAVAPIRSWLHDLASDPAGRQAVVFKTLDGAVRHTVMRAHDVADEMGEQVEAVRDLTDDVEETYDEAAGVVERELSDGSLLSGHVLTRWQEFVGTGELLRSVEEKVSRIRSRFLDGVTGKRTRDAEVAESIGTAIQALVVENAEFAAEATSRGWLDTPTGRPVLEASRGLERASHDIRTRAERITHDWQAEVTELVRARIADKRLSSDVLALGAGGLAVAVMTLVITSRAPQGSGESKAVAAGRTLLGGVLGVGVTDQLVADSLERLEQAVDALLAQERARYLELIDTPQAVEIAQTALRDAARQAEYARHTDFLEGGTSA